MKLEADLTGQQGFKPSYNMVVYVTMEPPSPFKYGEMKERKKGLGVLLLC